MSTQSVFPANSSKHPNNNNFTFKYTNFFIKCLWILLTGIVFTIIIYTFLVLYLSIFKPIRNNNPNPVSYFKEENWPIQIDPVWGHINKPNFAYYREIFYPDAKVSFHLFYDKNGARVNTKGEQLPDKVDFMSCGESNAWGYGIENEETFLSILGNLTHKKTANFALPGASGVVCMRSLDRAAGISKPKFMIYLFWEEHLKSNSEKCPNVDAPICLSRSHIYYNKNKSLDVFVPNLKTIQKDESLFRSYYIETSSNSDSEATLKTDIFWTNYVISKKIKSFFTNLLTRKAKSVNSIDASEFLLLKMQEVANKNNAILLVVYIPFYFNDINKTPDYIVSFAKAHNILFFSMEDKFKDLYKKKENFFFPDMHLNRKGHEAIAYEIYHFGHQKNLW